MEAQRKRVRSCNPAERLAAALLIPAELSRRLRLLGNSEIAQLLDCSIGNSKSQLHKAKLKMRDLLFPKKKAIRRRQNAQAAEGVAQTDSLSHLSGLYGTSYSAASE